MDPELQSSQEQELQQEQVVEEISKIQEPDEYDNWFNEHRI